MSYVDDLIESYRHRVALPWEQRLAGRTAGLDGRSTHRSTSGGCVSTSRRSRQRRSKPVTAGSSSNITNAFEEWMAGRKHREALLRGSRASSTPAPTTTIWSTDFRPELESADDPNGVVALLGAGTQFGLGRDSQGVVARQPSRRPHRRPPRRVLPGRTRGQQLSPARRSRRLELPRHTHRSRTGAIDDPH